MYILSDILMFLYCTFAFVLAYLGTMWVLNLLYEAFLAIRLMWK